MTGVRREARLKPEFARQYPNVPAGLWMAAADMGTALLLSHLHSASPPALGSRVMDERHFEFRGGAPRGPEARVRSRYGETVGRE